MKKFYLLFTACLTVSILFGQTNSIDQFFEKYSEDDRFTSVILTPKLFELAAKASSEHIGPEAKELISQIKHLRVLTTKENGAQFYDEAENAINLSEYEELVTVKGGEENVRILIADSDDGAIIHDAVILVNSEEFVFVHFSGAIDLANLSGLIKGKNWNIFNDGEEDGNLEAEFQEIGAGDADESGLDLGNNLHIENIEVYPNPSHGHFKLKFDSPETGNTLVTVFNQSGQLIYSKNVGTYQGNHSEDLDLMAPEPGIYYLIIRQNDLTYSRKLVVSPN